jgi:hypothetical protein
VGVGVEAAGSAVGTGSKEWRRTVGENSCDRREVGEVVEGTATFEEIHSARSVFRVHFIIVYLLGYDLLLLEL